MRVREADARVVGDPVSEGCLYSMGPCSPVAEGLISLRKAPCCQRLLMYLVPLPQSLYMEGWTPE